jgi:hypothetical protein
MRKNSVLAGELSAYSAIILGFAARMAAALKYFRRDIRNTFYAGMKKQQKRIFIFCNIFLSAYITFFVYVSHSNIFFTGKQRTLIVFFISIFIFLLVYNIIILVCSKYNHVSLVVLKKKEALKKETVVLFGGLCWVILLLSLAASFPGGKSPDTEAQWAQVHNLNFNDWHPVIHTLLIWLVTRIIDRYAFVVFVQITVFSIGVGYLIATLESWGFSKKHLLIAGLFITLNPYTMNIMMYPWKDLALTILITYTTIMTINIYYSGGSWFLKYGNMALFAVTTGIASIARHNGFFFTAPLYILIVLLYSKRAIKALFSVVLAVLVIFLVKVPLYNVLNVTYPHNTYRESVGIPMTILGDTLVKNPSRLPPEAKEFLNTIATDEEWREKYTPGDYNSIKFVSAASNIVETIPPKTLLKWVLRTCVSANYEAFHAFCDVTAIAWDIFKGGSMVGPPAPTNNNIIIKILHFCFTSYSGLCLAIPVISSLFANVGLLMLLLLLAGMLALGRNGTTVILLVVPSVCYNLGTMMLLCGPDVRFFHFNVVITLPLLFVLLTKQYAGNESIMDIIRESSE